MTLDQIDAALAEWQTRLAQAGDSLLELDDSATYQRLRGSADRPAAKLAGQTLAQVAPILALADGLWLSLQQLTEIVKRAESLRPALKRLWAHDAEQRQIEFLLLGASVNLPSVDMPFAQRGLLAEPDAARTMTPDQLLAQMTQNFTRVKDTVLALEDAWGRLSRSLAAANREAADLQALADQLGVDVRPSLDAARREIAVLHDRAASDPLVTSADLTAGLNALLAQARTHLDALKQQRDRVDSDLRRAHALLREINTLQSACQAVLAECSAKIEAFSLVPPAIPTDLAGWLQSVDAARQNQHFQSAQIGLDRWTVSAEDARAKLTAFRTYGAGALERREELRGLLRALMAKAGARAARSGAAVSPALSAAAQEAEALLHGRPTPLDRAASLVAEYERRLAAGEAGQSGTDTSSAGS